MSYTDDFLKELNEINKKKKKQEQSSNGKRTVTGGNDYTNEFLNNLDEDTIGRLSTPLTTRTFMENDDDIAPVKGGDKDSWFKSGGFSDGVDGVGDFFGDLGQTILGTLGDVGLGLVRGVGGLAEGIVDLGMYAAAGVSDLVGEDDLAKTIKKVASDNLVDEVTQGAVDYVDQYSIIGNKADNVTKGLGQVAGIILTGGTAGAAGLGAGGVAAVTTATTGLSSMGTNMGEAYKMGATDDQAFMYGLSTGAIEASTELLFGGLGKGVKALGVSRGIGGLDDMFAKKLSSSIVKNLSNESVQKVLGNTIEYAVKSGGEGFEEVLSAIGTAHMKNLTGLSDKEIGELIKDENLLEQFVVGTLTSAVAQSGYVPGMTSGSLREANITGRDFVTGYTQSEQAVIDKEVEKRVSEQEQNGKKLTNKEISKIEEQVQNDLEKGLLDIDMIESVLGGDTYKSYRETIETEEKLKEELSVLRNMESGKMNDIQTSRLAELKGMNLNDTSKRESLRKQLNDIISPKLNDSKLAESYRERARKEEAFKADLTQYTGKRKEAVQRAIDSGVLNNTYRAHELVDLLSKIEAEKGIVFDYTNNAKLKESGFAIEGKTVNGFANKSKGTVTLNVQSSKAWQSVVGHEITHILEGTEAYSELQKSLYAYAESKGELASRKAELSALYKDMDADIDAELTADLVGDYLFSDKNFINRLTGNRTLFQKIYDEIKYLCKVATGKELTEIEKVKREFDKVWKEYGKDSVQDAESNELGDTNVKYSISEEVDDYDRKFQMQQEIGEINRTLKEIENSAEYNAKMDEIKSLMSTNTDVAVKEWRKFIEESEYGKLSTRRDELTSRLDELSKKLREQETNELVVEEQKKIAKSGLSEADYFRKQAVKEFGYTPNFYDAGYIVPNGKMLNFSGEKGKHFGMRGQDHRAIGIIYETSQGTDAMYRFMKDGNVRVMESSPGIDLSTVVEPTKEQYATIRKFINEYESKGFFNVDLTDESGKVIGSLTYENRINPTRIINDIKHFYETGEIREQSKLDQFRYSISKETDADYITAIENGDMETAQMMVDEAAKNAGYNIKAYHGTGYDFTVFDKSKQGDNYQDWGRLGKGFYFAPTSREAETWAELSKGGKNKVLPVYLRSENMLDSFEALPDNLKDTIPADWEGLTRRLAEKYAYNYIEYMQEFGYNVQEILTRKGYDGINGHTEFVVFDPEQVKSADTITYDDNGNIISLSERFNTANDDIRFSLSKSVEETKNLVAIHNLQSSELAKTLELGGLPMPSIAIIKAEQGHEQYGDVSLILPKEAIDPQTNKDNKVYGGDAWTPTYPKIEYKPNEKVAKKIRDKYYRLADNIGYDEVRPLYSYVNELEDALNRAGGEAPMLEKLYEDTSMMNVYLQDIGKGKVESITKENVTKISDAEAEMNQFFIDTLGVDFVASFKAPDGENPLKYRTAFMEQHETEIREAYKRYFTEVHDFTSEEADNVLANTEKRDLMKIMRGAYMYTQNKGVTVRTETDYEATEKAIREAASGGYKEWVDGLFKGIEEKTGIRNNQDYYTRSGNPRSWDSLHWENTLENVIKVMKGQEETGVGSFSPFNNLFGASHKRYGSIQDIKADSDRLGEINQEEYDSMKDSFSGRFAEIAESIKDPDERNSFIAIDNAAEQIIEAVRTKKTKTGILNHLKELNSRATMQTVEDVLSLVSDIANMPTGYFEAKPQRAVGLDEVGVFVIPRNADVKLKQELLNRGYSIAEYDPDVEGDRQKVVNQFEEYKFSLSNVGEQPSTVGTPLRELYLAQESDIAPVADVPKNIGNKTDVFQDNYAPATAEEVESLSKKRFDTITDADLPPEVEAPYYGESYDGDPDNPFNERDMKEVGSQKVKAYMYENPEVKPFFQEAAETMLGDLIRTTRGERLWNQDFYNMSYDGQQENNRVIGVSRRTAPDIAELLDKWKYTYDEIENGIKAIIEDNGAENNACSKRIEFMLNDRLMYGYVDFDTGIEIPANEEYKNLLTEKQITEYNEEARKRFYEVADDYAPPIDDATEDIGPVLDTDAESTTVDEIPIPTNTDVPPLPDEIVPMTEEEANTLQDEKVNAHSATSLEAIQAELVNVKELRSESFASFEQKIANKLAEYKAKKNKDTKTANNLRMQIERLKRLRDSTDADYAKRIGTLETREKLVREGKPTTRQQHYNNIINDVKATFSSVGFDFDDVLEKARNLSTFSTVDNTPQRVMEKALGYKEGQTFSDITVNKAAQHETEGIRWLNSYTNRKRGLLAQLSNQYNIKSGSKESAAAQMYAEGFYVNEDDDIIAYGDEELAQDFPDASVRSNIKLLAQDPIIRQVYDETLDKMNEARTRNGYPEIPKLDNYFLHFRAMEDTFSKLGLPFNPNDIRAKDLPTDLNGVTADLKPGQPYFASSMHRKGKRTSFDLLGGLERYLTSAKNQIYHIDDIQTLRALRNYIADKYGQANGLENLDSLTEEEAEERIKEVYGSHLSTFAKFLNEEANVLAGKTALIDRGLEGIIGRRGITFLDTVNKQTGANMVGFNISSSLTNFIPVAQTFAKSNKFDFLKAFTQTVSNKLGSIVGKSDNFAEESPVIVRRKGADRFYRTLYQKAGDVGYVLMSAVDNISTELIARTKFNEFTRKGMSEQQAHFETDKWVSRLMGDRSLGQQPLLYNSKMLGILTKFQLEVRNQLDSQFYDTIQEAKASSEDIENGLAKNAKIAAKVTSTFLQLAVAQHIFGKAFESIAGYNPAFDIISTLATMFGFDDDEESEDTVLDNIEQGFLELLEDLPYTSTFTGGRIPISSALPIAELIKGVDSYGNEKSRLETLGEIAHYAVLPGGYVQGKKTAQGLGMFSDDHPVSGSYTDSKNLRFPVEDTPLNRLQAVIFGQYASENAREYFDNDYAPLKEKQIQEYIDVDIPIKDYWEYRKGLAKQETLEDKFDYISDLDLPVEKKNILINNVVDRKEEVDLENYDDFASLEEFDYATNNPEKYALAKSVGGYSSYKAYSTELYNIKADKDENGKSISGSRKEKVISYINNLDADYETKIILFKSEYPSDDTYNVDIINYLNNREDLTYEERVAIFTELGFTVSNGHVYWD